MELPKVAFLLKLSSEPGGNQVNMPINIKEDVSFIISYCLLDFTLEKWSKERLIMHNGN